MWLPTFCPLQYDTLTGSFCLHTHSKVGKFHSYSLHTSFYCPYLFIVYRSTHLHNSETWGSFLLSSCFPPCPSHQDISFCSPLGCIFLTLVSIISTVPLPALPLMAVTIIRKVLIVVSMQIGPYHSCVRPFSKVPWILWGECVA